MIPVLYTFVFSTAFAQAVFYALGAALVAYSAWMGWQGAVGRTDAKTGKATPPGNNERAQRALTFGAVGAALVALGGHYALPPGAFLGGTGEGIPVHTYGVLLGLGFISAVSVSGRLAYREWHDARPLPAEVPAWLEAANAAVRAGAPAPVVPPVVRPYQPHFRRAKDGTLSLPRLFSLEGARKREQVMDLAFWVLVGGIGGSKLLFLVVNWDEYTHVFARMGAGLVRLQLGSVGAELMRLLSGGLVFYGGLIGAAAMAYWWSRNNQVDFLRLADLAIPTVSLGQCLGRLGCFSAGCCWGGVTRADNPLAVHFPGTGHMHDVFGGVSSTPSLAFSSMQDETRWVVEATGQVLDAAAPGAVRIADWVAQHGHTLPVHPTQLMESVGQLALFVALIALRGRRRFHGQIFSLWLMAYAVLRTTVELFRGDAARGTLHGLLKSLGAEGLAQAVPQEAWFNISTSQFISLVLFALGLTLLVQRGRRVASARLPPAGAAPAGA
ncbi:MAG: prolipoprotein diacylglyceryl transferase [Myxococcaceae bacterium]|nr:prolipoprotein diacylglyceryl transferase [Myxococcaceae bacterium]